MNQILEFGTQNSGKAPRGGGSSMSDKIVRVFAILLMILAIVLIGSGVMSLMENKKTAEANESPEVETIKASIDANIDEETGKVVIEVSNEIEIELLIYNWNQEPEKEVAGEDSKTLEKEIDLPSGINTLNVKVVDIEGHETVKSFTFESATGTDLIKPNITIGQTEDNNLLIVATDETALSYITYMWNEGEQVRVDVDEDNPKEIRVELEIPKGENTITVIAVDASEISNTNSATELLKGFTKPEIGYGLTSDESTLEFVCTHENGIKKIYYTLNDKPYEATFEDSEAPTEVSFTQALDEGYNRIILEVTSVDGTVAKFDGQCEYWPNGNTSETSTDETQTSENSTDTQTDEEE